MQQWHEVHATIYSILCGYETWSHTQGRTHIKDVENRMMRRIFGLKRKWQEAGK
jgi:hypothetical protein